MNARAVVPDFELPATGNQRFRLSAFHGHPLVFHIASFDRARRPSSGGQGMSGFGS